MSAGESGAIAADIAEVGVSINGLQVDVDDPIATGRQVLSAGGFDPASEHVLIRLLPHGSQSVGLDERIDLRHSGPFLFRAFESDRTYNFTLDERGYEWGAPAITEAELRQIGSVPDEKVIVLERKNEPDLELEADDEVRLDKAGTEHLKTKMGLVPVSIDGVEKNIPRGVYTTEELLAVLGVEPGYVLDMVNADGHLEALKPGQKIRVKKGMKFISQVPCGGSS